MYALIPYKEKTLKINLWNIGDEKNFLLNYGNMEHEDFNKIIKELAHSLITKNNKDMKLFIEETHFIDIIYILFKCSLYVNANSKKEYRVKCTKCSQFFQTTIDLSDDKNIYFNPYKDKNIIIDGISIKITSKNIKDLDENIIKNISIKSYKLLKKLVKNVGWDFYIKNESFCPKCGCKNIFVNDYNDIFLNNIIESDLKYYYEALFFLKKTMGISMEEFDKMKNFEVEILITKMNELLKNEEGQ